MDEDKTATRKGRRLKVSHVLIILLLICVGAFAYYRLSLKSKLQARIDAIRAAGYPVTCAELDEWYTIPENVENAAYTIMDAFSYYKEWDKAKSKSLPVVGQAKLPARTEPLDEETKVLIAQYIADHNEALELLHAAAAIENYRYPIDFSAGNETLIPDLRNLKRGVELLSIEAISHGENKNPGLSAHSLISSFNISRCLVKEPMLVSHLARTACQALTVTILERIVNRTDFRDEQLVELSRAIVDAQDRLNMSNALVGNRCMMLSVFKDPVSVNPDIFGVKLPSAPVLELYKALGIADMDAIICLDILNDFMETTRLPLHRRQEAADAIDARLKSVSKIHILLPAVMPPLSRITTIDLRAIAGLRSAQVALAVQRYRLAVGRLPDTLADLVPTYLEAVPQDPFDGNELRYKKLEPGFVVYSIGQDLSDDGGKEQLTRSERRGKPGPFHWDITFTVER